jgi:hypothetical protein
MAPQAPTNWQNRPLEVDFDRFDSFKSQNSPDPMYTEQCSVYDLANSFHGGYAPLTPWKQSNWLANLTQKVTLWWLFDWPRSKSQSPRALGPCPTDQNLRFWSIQGLGPWTPTHGHFGRAEGPKNHLLVVFGSLDPLGPNFWPRTGLLTLARPN